MRNHYLADYEHMTDIGRWVAARVPHTDIARGVWGNEKNLIVRLFGFAPLYRRCIFDYTRMVKNTGKPPVSRLRIFKWTVWNTIDLKAVN